MRRTVAVFVAAVLVAVLTGCGGGGEETAAPAQSEAPAPAPAAPAAAPGAPGVVTASIGDRSKVESDFPAPFPEPNENTPREVSDSLKLKQPILILFVDRSQKTTDDVKVEVSAVARKYRGLIDVATYDIAPAVDADRGSKEASESLQAALFAKDMNIGYAPYIIIVDRTGTILWRSSGYVDRGLVEREVLRATQ